MKNLSFFGWAGGYGCVWERLVPFSKQLLIYDHVYLI